MLRLLIFLTILISSSWHTRAQHFSELTSKIFFNLKLSSDADTFLASCDSMPELTRLQTSGWTMYPPTDETGKPIPFIIYSFLKHPYFPGIEDGNLMVLTKKEANQLVGVSLSVSFETNPDFESAYDQIIKLYGSYAEKVIRRPNIAKPFEVTKFLAKDNSFIVVTIGESENKPYMHVAYNYQGYEW